MHYIRFLKLPVLSPRRTGVHLNAKITITTDLGESFLCIDLSILVILVDHTGNHGQVHPYQWKAGKRELEISFSLPFTSIQLEQWSRRPRRLLVQPRDAKYRLNILADVLSASFQGDRTALVLPVLSGELIDEAVVHHVPERIKHNRPDLDDQRSNQSMRIVPKRVARQVQMVDGDGFYIWEETGESIARHIWDAGLLLAAYLDSTSASVKNSGLTCPEYLNTLLSKDQLDVLELGTGCGIVGITFARRFPKAKVLITDMYEAEEIAEHNVSMIAEQPCLDGSFAKISYQNLDWEKRIPESLRSLTLDLILVADCTYNSDVVPDLVKTLADIVKHNQEVLILVAMKIRHYSEMVFFDLMKEKNLIALDKVILPLPLLGQDSEEIELHFFKAG